MVEDKKTEEKKVEQDKKVVETGKVEDKKMDEKKTDKKDKKKVVEKEIKPKDKAVVYGKSLRLSLKHCIGICKMINGKMPERAIEMLEEVVKGKRAVRMPLREVAHQKSRGEKNVAGGRFPMKASKEIIVLVKQLQANANVSGVENPVIVKAIANKASQPYRREGKRAKRCHVYLEVMDKTKLKSGGPKGKSKKP